jgi:hypothetical protein
MNFINIDTNGLVQLILEKSISVVGLYILSGILWQLFNNFFLLLQFFEQI